MAYIQWRANNFWTEIMRHRDITPGVGVLPYVCILGMCRKRDPHFQPWISVPEHIIFTNFQKTPFRSITILHFLADFAVPETIIFKISLISTRSSPPTAGSARTQRCGLARRVLAVPESPIFTLKRIKLVPGGPHFKLKTAQARSGNPHFHARQGARSGALVNFSLCRGTYMYLPKFGVSTPSPRGGGGHNISFWYLLWCMLIV